MNLSFAASSAQMRRETEAQLISVSLSGCLRGGARGAGCCFRWSDGAAAAAAMAEHEKGFWRPPEWGEWGAHPSLSLVAAIWPQELDAAAAPAPARRTLLPLAFG